MEFKNNGEKYSFDELVEIVRLLRAPGGCPWDREQTHRSIKNNLIEEGYELIEARDGGDPHKIADESGDMLLQVVFHAVIADENGEYDINDVTDAISRKLIHRHPHVFGDVTADTSSEVLKNWDAIKRADRSQNSVADELRGVSKYLPSLMRAAKIQKKAEKAGFEMQSGSLPERAPGECGRMLFEAAVMCRKSGVEPEVALSEYIDEFINDFEKFERDKNETR